MDIRGPDLPLLVSLDMLLEEKNVTRAASRLHLSQPAMSAQLARLRDLFGDPLLMTAENGRGMVPTPRALDLQQPLRSALEALGQAISTVPSFDPKNSKHTFRIAGNDNCTTTVMMAVIRQLDRHGGRGLRLAVVPHDLNRIVTQMERGEIDLLACASRFVPESLRTRQMTSGAHKLGQRKGHPRGIGELTLEQYCAMRHVIVSNEGGFHGFMDELLKTHGLQREVVASVPQYSLVPTIIANTDFVCTMPEDFLTAHADRLDMIDLPIEAGKFDLSIAWHPRSDNDPAHRWLRDQIGVNIGEFSVQQ
ncbi:LysR family transcriptional regulator [Undibacterium sp. CY21W]|uniref:LysR family transcriptional regulator n=1 Tax=Undibacterium sp. CY21W TaxID=2762293 RepID=UPI001C9ACE89|nr:LysR family transcriptional regulator [Undibacterium sp. CY21W]